MKRLAFLCALVATSAAAAPTYVYDQAPMEGRVFRALQDEEQHGRLADKALDAMVREASRQLKKHPDKDEPKTVAAGSISEDDKILVEWESFYADTLSGDRVVPVDMGDHKPLSEWLSKLYAKLEKRLPNKVLELTHLKDIWIMNHGLPVVLKPKQESQWCKDQLARYSADSCAEEYRRHFAGTKWVKGDPYATAEHLHGGLAGVIAYWVTWGACTVATWGADFSLICGPAGSLVQRFTEKRIGPKVAKRIWDRRNKA